MSRPTEVTLLERLDEGMWIAGAPLTYMGLHLGTRMTVVRLANGDLWVHSPIALTDELGAAVDALGPVRHIVAPSLYHHLSAGEWHKRYANASFWGPAALAKKRKDLTLTAKLEEAATAPWAGELAPVHVDGCMLDETVFLHGATRTIVSADLTENFATSSHWFTRVYLKASGIHGKPGWGRFLRILYRDRAAARKSVDALLALDFDRIVIAHGDIIRSGGKEAIRSTFEFLG
jgi:hypothetical protein